MPEYGLETTECPACQSALPVHRDYVTWCERCGWNLNPLKPKAPRGRLEEVYVALGQKHSRALLEEEFNASFGRVGWKQREVLTLGLPLWAILEDAERVALIAHELAHGVNGDPVRGFYVGSAVAALARWHVLLHPDRIWDEEKGVAGLPAIPFNLAMAMLANLARLAASVLAHLLWRDSHEFEAADKELRPFRKSVQLKLEDKYRASLYA